MSASIKSKYLAIGTFVEGSTPEQLNPFMSREVPATLKLYVDGKMDQFWLRHDGKGVVFVMTTETAEEAGSLLKALPLGQADLLHFELIPIGTLTAFGILAGESFSVGK
ncbi:MAG: hypothetical protein WDN23_14675 [Edaphobacter sp.]